MAWITPSTGGTTYDGALPDFDPIEVVLKEVTVGLSTYKEVTNLRATLVWETIEPPGLQLMDWASVTLNDAPGGQPSKMKQIINAIEGRPAPTKVSGVNPELEYCAVTLNEISGQIKPGVRVIVRGQNVTKEVDGESRQYFNIQHYFPVAKKPASGKPVAAKPTTEPVAEPALSSDF